MKIAFLIVVILHGLIHLLGFVKGLEFCELKELTLPISKRLGFFWLTASILFFTYGVSHFMNSQSSWLLGFISVLFSQVLIILFWDDAKCGSIPNFIILIVAIVSFAYYDFQKTIQHETTQLLQKNVGTGNRILNESDLTDLPEPIKKWLKNSGSIGKPFIRFGKVTQIAELQMTPKQDNWLGAKAIQYSTIDTPSFIWSVDVKMNSLLSFNGRDKFCEGKGEMLIKMNSLVDIVNEHGEKLDEATMQRFLGEMVWFPSLALSPFITWRQIDENTAKATMNFKGTTASGTFYFNLQGDVIKYSALRYKGNEKDAKRYQWEMNISGYKTFEGIKVPARMTSTWKLDDKDWTWLKMEVIDIEYNASANH